MMTTFGKGLWKNFREGIEREWVITNGIGGYCGSTIIGAHARKHHGMLIASLHPPVERYMVFSKLDEKLTVGGRVYDLATNQRSGGWNEEGQKYLQRFTYDELPEFEYFAGGVFLNKQISMEYGKNTVAIAYEITNCQQDTTLELVPWFNFRDHSSRSERAELCFEHGVKDNTITLAPHKNKNVAIKLFVSEGTIAEREQKYDSDLVLQTEIDTGMECIDNNFTPYVITVEVKAGETKRISLVCSVEESFGKDAFAAARTFRERIRFVRQGVGYNDDIAQRLAQAADQFIVDRRSTGYKTVLAGLPWFTDWGRDTMIALQGLTLCTGRFEDAKGILRTFAKYVKNGLVPNVFPDTDAEPAYNTVDASMWYFYAVWKYLGYTGEESDYQFIKEEIFPKLEEIVKYYKNGTEFSIYMDEDGLISAGGGFDQVTWMDVRVGEWVVTPRHGKPVEINALWYNALKVMEKLSARFADVAAVPSAEYKELAQKVKASFNEKFWNEERACLFDVVSAEENDPKIRPNQIWAVSLPFSILPEEKEKAVVEAVLQHLYVGFGLRSLSPQDDEYIGTYFGKLHDRDAAYHQGTAWAFPMGAFITAYVKVNHASEESVAFARRLFAPVEDHLDDGCIGSIAEIFDGDGPNTSRGCYAQAWSVGELLRCYCEDILENE